MTEQASEDEAVTLDIHDGTIGQQATTDDQMEAGDAEAGA